MLSDRPRLLTRVLGLTLASGLATSIGAQPESFGVDDQASYDQFKAAVRAAEYVREDYIVGSIPTLDGNGNVVAETEVGTKPRVAAVLAATMAFVERNPSVGPTEVSAFINSFDVKIADLHQTDPDLVRPENFLAALRFCRVVGDVNTPGLDSLIGFDTAVNERAFELLGLELPSATSKPQMERRVRAHEAATGANIGASPEFGELLVRAFTNQSPTGVLLASDIATPIAAYLETNGYDPELGGTRTEHAGVNDSIAQLPATYSGLAAELSQPFVDFERMPGESDEDFRARLAPSPLQNRMRAAVYGTFDITGDTIDEIGPELSFDDSSALSPAERQAILAEMREDIRATSAPRTSLLANSFLLYNDIQQPADLVFEAHETGSSAIGISNALSTGVAAAKLGVAASNLRSLFAAGDAAGAVDPFITTTDGLIKILGISESNVLGGRINGDIYNQITQLQGQLMEMEQRIDGRFDRVDAKLDVLFASLNDQFEAVLDLSATVDFAVDVLLDQSNAIRRLDDTVRAIGRDELNQLFNIGVDLYLGARQNNADLPWIGGFDTAANLFFTAATSTADDTAFVGNASNPFQLSEADETIGDGAISGRLAELLAFAPPFLDSTVGLDPEVVGPEPWSLSATAYAQLAHESPWYFAKWISNQTSSPRDIDDMIAEGEKLERSIDVLRQTGLHGFVDDNGDPVPEFTIFVNLIQEYQLAAFALQSEINTEIERALANDFATPLSNGTVTLNLWADDFEQNLAPLVGDIDRIVTGWGGSSTDLITGAPGIGDFVQGYSYLARANVPGPTGSNFAHVILGAQTRSLVRQALGGGVRPIHWYNSRVDDRAWNIVFEMSLDSTQPTGGEYDIRRRMTYLRELDLFNSGNWIANPPSNVSDAANIFLNVQAAGNTVFSSQWDDSLPMPGLLGTSPYVYSATGGSGLARVKFISDAVDENTEAITLYQDDIRTIRSQIRNTIKLKLADETSSLAQAAAGLDDIEAVIDAYVALVRPSLLDNSTIARSILRGVPGGPNATSNEASLMELGMRSETLPGLIDRFETSDDSGWGNSSFDIRNIGDLLFINAETLREELVNALDLPNESAPYFLWSLEELKNLRDHSDRLAIDDSFETHRAGNMQSVLDNDIRQLRSQDVVNGQVIREYRPIEADISFGPGDTGFVAPSHGQVTINADGTFTYTPDAGYIGQDRFTYRARCDITADANGNNGGTIAYSAPAWVVVNVTESCLADVNGDGMLSPTDFTAWISAFNNQSAGCDQNNDGDCTPTDFTAWISNYNADC
ncbi:MAG: hypothetical protein Phyf2KO_00920 [Phycisphaerales bacterium]